MASPFMHLPFSDIALPKTHQTQDACADFEMRYVDCMEAYGIPLGNKTCVDFLDDFNECFSRNKRLTRMEAMQAERKRQIRAGETTYYPPPAADSTYFRT